MIMITLRKQFNGFTLFPLLIYQLNEPVFRRDKLANLTRVLRKCNQYFQAEYAAALIAGKFQLPTQGDMLKSWLKYVYELQSKGKKIVDVNFLDNLQVRSGQRKRNMGTGNQGA